MTTLGTYATAEWDKQEVKDGPKYAADGTITYEIVGTRYQLVIKVIEIPDSLFESEKARYLFNEHWTGIVPDGQGNVPGPGGGYISTATDFSAPFSGYPDSNEWLKTSEDKTSSYRVALGLRTYDLTLGFSAFKPSY